MEIQLVIVVGKGLNRLPAVGVKAGIKNLWSNGESLSLTKI